MIARWGRQAAFVSFLAASTIVSPSLLAATRYVSTAGSNIPPYTNWHDAATAIQPAVDAASDGDTILVSNGVYSVSNQISVTKGVTVRGLEGAGATAIEANGATRCVFLSHANAVVEGLCIRNGVGSDGAGVFIATSGLVRSCIITNNHGGDGGGVACSLGGTIRSCAIAGNSGAWGGGVYCYKGGSVENCTIVNNQASVGAGISFNEGGKAVNTIVWSNAIDVFASSSNLTYSCFTPTLPGSGNITNNPLLTPDCQPQLNSPCINAGTNLAWMSGATDLLGMPRVADGLVDMGAYEINTTVDRDLRIISATTSGECFRLAFAPIAGITNYQFESSSNLLPSSWLPMGAPIVVSIGAPELVDSNQSIPQCFYRVRGLPPPDTTPPGDVVAFSAVGADSVVALRWTNPTDRDFAGVRVQRKVGGDPVSTIDGTNICTGMVTNYVDSGLINGTSYHYKAFSYDWATNYANGVSVVATPSIPDTTPPDNVGNFTATGGNAQVFLRWTNPGGDFVGVRIQRKTSDYPTNATDGTTVYDGGESNAEDTGVINGTLYYYTAFSYDAIPNYASGVSTTATPAVSITLSPLYSFTGGSDSWGYKLTLASDGNFYGVTASDWGSVFRISHEGNHAILHTFTGGSDGATPVCALVQANDGKLYGTTYAGGAYGWGTVFSITTNGELTTIVAFSGASSGTHQQFPGAGLIQAADGNFYGTTVGTGYSRQDLGAVFSMTPSGLIRTLHWFAVDSNDGASPQAALVQGADGDFWGTTVGGGQNLSNLGTVFKVSTNGTFHILHSFIGSDGSLPTSELVQGADGRFYGTTSSGGSKSNNGGTIFKISPSGGFTSIFSFSGNARPNGGLMLGSDGAFYGTTVSGGDYGHGSVFKYWGSGAVTTPYSFTGGADGANPWAGLVQGTNGDFYGTTRNGGANGYGTIFRLSIH